MKLWNFAHAVTRFHTTPQPGIGQNLADHSWGVALLVSRHFAGTKDDRLVLMEAALEHDLAEATTGDIPKYVKSPEQEKIEKGVAEQHGLAHLYLRSDLVNWLKWADLLEAGLYAQHQVALGNSFFVNVLVNVNNSFLEDAMNCPPELLQLARSENLCL